MTTDHELDAILRRALHTAVDSVEPAGDGLQLIQRQLGKPRLQRQTRLLLTETVDLICLIGIRLEPVAAWLLATLRRGFAAAVATLRRAFAAAGAAFRPPAAADGGQGSARPRRGAAHRSRPPGRLASRLGPAMIWLRPTLAVAGAVVIVVAGVATLFTLRQTVTDISLLTGGSQSPSASHSPAPPSSVHSGAPGAVAPSPQATRKPRHKSTRHHAVVAPTCTPAPAGRPPAVSPSPTVSASPSVTPTVTPTPTDTTSPSPSTSTSVAVAPATSAAAVPNAGGPVQLTSGC